MGLPSHFHPEPNQCIHHAPTIPERKTDQPLAFLLVCLRYQRRPPLPRGKGQHLEPVTIDPRPGVVKSMQRDPSAKPPPHVRAVMIPPYSGIFLDAAHHSTPKVNARSVVYGSGG